MSDDAVNVQSLIERTYRSLDAWCRKREYRGHDPFDALNSALFQATPIARSSRTARLLWTQAFKRSPLNLRRLARVPVEKNAKGTALFALAAVAEFRSTGTKEAEAKARRLLEELQAARLRSKSNATCWGYNFDWQGRAFFVPKGTPTIVPTAFAARALTEAAQAFDDESYLKLARSACDFVLRDLNRTEETEEEVCWSYSPLDQTRVYNASLLASEMLATTAALTDEEELKRLAWRGVRYVLNRQREDGSWAYGADAYQSWSDNFHTAFVLTSLTRIMRACPQRSDKDDAREAIARGFKFWSESFFLADGWPKYYHNRLYPADAHSAGAAIVALMELRLFEPTAFELAEKITLWAARHLRAPEGFFYYQRRRFHTVRTPYMRWSQAWMLYALARLIEERGNG